MLHTVEQNFVGHRLVGQDGIVVRGNSSSIVVVKYRCHYNIIKHFNDVLAFLVVLSCVPFTADPCCDAIVCCT